MTIRMQWLKQGEPAPEAGILVVTNPDLLFGDDEEPFAHLKWVQKGWRVDPENLMESDVQLLISGLELKDGLKFARRSTHLSEGGIVHMILDNSSGTDYRCGVTIINMQSWDSVPKPPWAILSDTPGGYALWATKEGEIGKVEDGDTVERWQVTAENSLFLIPGPLSCVAVFWCYRVDTGICQCEKCQKAREYYPKPICDCEEYVPTEETFTLEGPIKVTYTFN